MAFFDPTPLGGANSNGLPPKRSPQEVVLRIQYYLKSLNKSAPLFPPQKTKNTIANKKVTPSSSIRELEITKESAKRAFNSNSSELPKLEKKTRKYSPHKDPKT